MPGGVGGRGEGRASWRSALTCIRGAYAKLELLAGTGVGASGRGGAGAGGEGDVAGCA